MVAEDLLGVCEEELGVVAEDLVCEDEDVDAEEDLRVGVLPDEELVVWEEDVVLLACAKAASGVAVMAQATATAANSFIRFFIFICIRDICLTSP